METLNDFAERFCKSTGCYWHESKSGVSLKKIDTSVKGKMGVFAWISMFKKNMSFKITTIKDPADKAGVNGLADGEKPNMNWNKPGYFFMVENGSSEEDFSKAVRAIKAMLDII